MKLLLIASYLLPLTTGVSGEFSVGACLKTGGSFICLLFTFHVAFVADNGYDVRDWI